MVVVSLGWKGDTIATGVAAEGEVVTLGDGERSIAPLSTEVLGAASLRVADVKGGPHVLVPEGKVASIRAASGQMRLVVGPAREALGADEEASMLFGAFDVVVTGVAKSAETKGKRFALGAWTHTVTAAAIHAALLFAGSRGALAAQLQSEEAGPNVDAMRAYLAAAEERSAAADEVLFGKGGSKDPSQKANGQHGNGKDGGGERHEGAAGKAGSSESRGNKGHWSATAKPSKSTGTPETEDDLAAARSFGLVSVLTAMNGDAGSQGAVGLRRASEESPWGASDPFAAVGAMLGQSVGESEGTGGLALTGIGEGGGGRGDGIGLGTIGTIGHANGMPGIGTGGSGMVENGSGFGSSWGHWGGSHRARRSVSWGHGWGCCTSVSGRLPPEAIQRIVRQNFGRFRACYEDGLKRNPSLEGRVTTSFVIGLDGSVSNVSDGGADLPDASVKACVNRQFYGLSFPQPEGGIVTVTYPISFSSLGTATPSKPIAFTPGE